jgi:hypothetical protein
MRNQIRASHRTRVNVSYSPVFPGRRGLVRLVIECRIHQGHHTDIMCLVVDCVRYDIEVLPLTCQQNWIREFVLFHWYS